MRQQHPDDRFSLLGEKVFLAGSLDKLKEDRLLDDEDHKKLERLQLINASARYELLSAN